MTVARVPCPALSAQAKALLDTRGAAEAAGGAQAEAEEADRLTALAGRLAEEQRKRESAEARATAVGRHPT